MTLGNLAQSCHLADGETEAYSAAPIPTPQTSRSLWRLSLPGRKRKPFVQKLTVRPFGTPVQPGTLHAVPTPPHRLQITPLPVLPPPPPGRGDSEEDEARPDSRLSADERLQGSLIFKTSFHIFLIKQLIQIQNQLHKSNIIRRCRLQGSRVWPGARGSLPDRAVRTPSLRFSERFIGFHSPLRGNPLNVFAIISLITLSALGHSLDLTEIRNWKLLSQYEAINLCHLPVTAAQENNVVS